MRTLEIHIFLRLNIVTAILSLCLLHRLDMLYMVKNSPMHGTILQINACCIHSYSSINCSVICSCPVLYHGSGNESNNQSEVESD